MTTKSTIYDQREREDISSGEEDGEDNSMKNMDDVANNRLKNAEREGGRDVKKVRGSAPTTSTAPPKQEIPPPPAGPPPPVQPEHPGQPEQTAQPEQPSDMDKDKEGKDADPEKTEEKNQNEDEEGGFSRH
mmetsp:Transcript_14317/g.25498  ORF Transcript_14317/g.25498 Transcript_14317/m.25498 type:complete len:131 (-) Transcript_14317:36-428(-)